LLVAVTEVGSLASAVGWLISSVVYWKLGSALRHKTIASMAILVALAFVLIKLLPWAPGHFSASEYIAMAAWLALGIFLRIIALRRKYSAELTAAAR
jgi:hypothetical protein